MRETRILRLPIESTLPSRCGSITRSCNGYVINVCNKIFPFTCRFIPEERNAIRLECKKSILLTDHEVCGVEDVVRCHSLEVLAERPPCITPEFFEALNESLFGFWRELGYFFVRQKELSFHLVTLPFRRKTFTLNRRKIRCFYPRFEFLILNVADHLAVIPIQTFTNLNDPSV